MYKHDHKGNTAQLRERNLEKTFEHACPVNGSRLGQISGDGLHG